MCASVPGMVLAYGYLSDIVITSTLFHSQKFSHLDNTFYGHPVYEEVHGGAFCREHNRIIPR